MVRINRLLILVAACGLAACDQMGTEPTGSAPVGMGRSNDNGSQFSPNPFPSLGSFQDEDGSTCVISWGVELDRNDFLKTNPQGVQELHVSGDTDIRILPAGGGVWTGTGHTAGIARISSAGLDYVNFSASGKVTNLSGDEAQAECHVQVRNNEFTKTTVKVN